MRAPGAANFTLVAWMERSEIRDTASVELLIPDCAALHPGYKLVPRTQRSA
jgi:hypothetical protein